MPHLQHRGFSRLDDAMRAEFGDEAERPHWVELLRSGVAIFDLDYDVILAAMYALSVSAEGDCYLCMPPDPGIEAAALGASEYVLHATARAEALHTFTLDSSASRCFFRDSTTLTPVSAHVPVRLADPSGGPDLARSSTVLPWLSLYTLATEPPQVAVSSQVSSSGQVEPPCSCRLLSHQTLLWHHRLGHPSLPRLRGMHSRLLVSGLPRSLPPLPPSPAPPCLPCIEGRQRAAPHSSSFPLTTAPLQTLHMDVWGPARVSGQGRERYFLLVVDDYTRYTTVFPLRSKGQVIDVLIPWIHAVRLQLREWFRRTFLSYVCTLTEVRTRLWSGAAGARASAAGDTGAGGAGVTGGAGGGAAAGSGGARTRATGAAGTGGARAVGAGAGGTGVGGAGARGAGAVDLGAGGAGGTVRPRPYFVPLLQHVLGVPSSTGLTPTLLCPPADQSQPPLQPAFPLPAPPYIEQTGSLTELQEPVSRPTSLIRTGRRVPRTRPPPVPGTHAMALRPSSVPLRVPLPPPPESSLPDVCHPESDRTHVASPTVPCLLTTVVTDPSFESTAASELVVELVDFVAACCLDYATALIAESKSASPPSVGKAITGPYSSHWHAAMDAEMASWKSTGTYVDEVPPPGANIVDGMWIFRRDYELHSMDLSTAFLQGSMHEEIWLCRPPGFTGL
ncbi:unnamed protein product [Closterium sp. NIES-53]